MPTKNNKDVDKIKVGKTPTPDQEANQQFSNADERRLTIGNAHDLAKHDKQLGYIGKFTGSTNPSLNIAALMLAGLFLVLIICMMAALGGVEKTNLLIERLIAAILTVGGFVFGVRQGRNDD